MGAAFIPGFRFPSAAHELWALLILASAGPVEARSHETATSLGLSPVSAWALIQLEPGKPMSQKELAERLHCSPSTVVDPTDRLEKRRLVVRRSHPSDRRINVLEVTAAGKRVRKQLISRLFDPPGPLRRLATQDQIKFRAVLLELLSPSISASEAAASAAGEEVNQQSVVTNV